LKIKDLNVGDTVTIDLLVKSSEIKLTRAQKPYLFAILTDGTDELQGQDWDFGNGTPPAKNTVLEVYGTISEYMGKKQIKIISFVESTKGVELFAPSGDVDVAEYVLKAKALYDSIVNPFARELCQTVFKDNASGWKTLPAAKGMHHAFVSGLLKHTVDVATKAKAIAELTPMVNVDLVVAGALLHDMGKLWTYELHGALIEMSDEGQMLEHIMVGAMRLDKYRTPENSDVLDLILHIISSHHGELEYGSPTTPRFLEAVIVNYADGVDAKSQMIIEQNLKTPVDAKMTDKVWALGNRPMFSQMYISSIMNN
jgi:3'-5' exoribonuclease